MTKRLILIAIITLTLPVMALAKPKPVVPVVKTITWPAQNVCTAISFNRYGAVCHHGVFDQNGGYLIAESCPKGYILTIGLTNDECDLVKR